MDVFERYLEKLEDKDKESFNNYKFAAREYFEQGLSELMVQELLVLDGCPKKVAEKLVVAAHDSLPYDYVYGDPPKNFEDVRRKVEESIRVADLNDIDMYFKKHAPKGYSYIPALVRTARATDLPSHYKEVVEAVRPLVDSIILDIRVKTPMVKSAKKITEKEFMEQELWGIWPLELIHKHAHKEESHGIVIKKAERKNKGKSLFSD